MREMRMKNRQRDEAFAWEVLRQSVYATLALVKDDGTPIAVPINAVGDEVYKVIYFHCAGVGEKWEILEKNPHVSLSVVSHAAIKPMAFDTVYRAARFVLGNKNIPSVFSIQRSDEAEAAFRR